MKPKLIKTPQEMQDLFDLYKVSLKPREIQKATAAGVKSEFHTPPLTFEGFQNFCEDTVCCVHQYFENRDNRYNEYVDVCTRIRRLIRQDQIEGGMVGQFNPSITQRLNGLTEKTDVTTNGKEISKIEIQIVTNENQID
jgi:hypothetical protein